jgi:hypothetical protein
MAAGVTPWAAYAPKGAASFAASLVDLTGQGHDAVDPGGAATPGWDAVNGWTFDGLAQYLTTTFVPQIDGSQSMFVQFTGAALVTRWMIGAQNAAAEGFRIMPQRVGASVRYANGNANSDIVTQLAAGNLGIAGQEPYRNGADDGGPLAAWSGLNPMARAVWIGTNNTDGVTGSFFDGEIQAVILCDVTLTGPQAALIAGAMAAL